MSSEEYPRGTVAVGVDGSHSSDTALIEAVRVAVAEQRPLTIVHAVSGAAAALLGQVRGEWSDVPAATRETLDAARAAVGRMAPALEVHAVLEVGDARTTLLRVSERASLMVLGSHGRGPIRSRVLGSVALAVTRGAACPVLVARPHHPGTVRHGVIVGADGAPSSASTLEFAFRQASRRRLPLTVHHAVPAPVMVGAAGYVPEVTVDDLAEHQVLVGEALAGLGEQYPDVRVHVEVVRGNPPDTLVRRAERMDLAVVGAHRGGRAAELLLGSVAASVLERAHCLVAVVPLGPEEWPT